MKEVSPIARTRLSKYWICLYVFLLTVTVNDASRVLSHHFGDTLGGVVSRALLELDSWSLLIYLGLASVPAIAYAIRLAVGPRQDPSRVDALILGCLGGIAMDWIVPI